MWINVIKIKKHWTDQIWIDIRTVLVNGSRSRRWNLTFNWSKDNNVCYVRILQKLGQTRNIWWKQWNWRDISPLIDLHRVCETYKHSQRISAWTGFYSSIMIIPVNILFIGLRNFPWSSTRTPMDITLVLHKIEMTNLLK